MAYDVDGHGLDSLPKAIVLLKNVNALELEVLNLSEQGMNFGMTDSGVISNISKMVI